MLAELAERADALGADRALGQRLRARVGPALLGLRGRARRVRRGARSAPPGVARGRRAGRARAGAPVAVRVRRSGRGRRSRTSATARIAPCGSCSSAWRPPSRSCSCSTTSTGPTQPRSSCSAPCCAGRPGLGADGRRRAPAAAPRAAGGDARARPPHRLAHAPRARPPSARRRRPPARRGSSTATLADSIYEESGGNPFFLEQLARAPHPPGRAAAGTGGLDLGGIEVPAAVVAALTEELGLLSKPTRALLDGAAVAGDPFEPELAAAAAGADEQTAAQALDELLARDLVRPTDVPRRFRFRHPLVRRTVYETAPGRLAARRARALRGGARGARRIAGGPGAPRGARGPPGRRRRRSRCCGTPGSRQGCGPPRAPRAGSAPRCACCRTAHRSRSAAHSSCRARRRSRRRGSSSSAHEDLLETLGLVPDAAVALRVRLIVACASVEHLLGRHEAGAHAPGAGALTHLPDPVGAEAVALMVELAIDGLFRADYEEMREFAERALEAAEPLGDGSAHGHRARGADARVRVRRARSTRRSATAHGEPSSWTPCATTSSPAASTRPPTSPRPRSTSTDTARPRCTPSARSRSGARPESCSPR